MGCSLVVCVVFWECEEEGEEGKGAHGEIVGLVVPERELAVGVVWLEGGAALTTSEADCDRVRG